MGPLFRCGVPALARNRTAGCMLVEAQPASVPFSTLVQIFGCILETVHPCAALVRIAGCMLERVHPAPPPSRVHVQMYLGVGCWAGFVERGRSS